MTAKAEKTCTRVIVQYVKNYPERFTIDTNKTANVGSGSPLALGLSLSDWRMIGSQLLNGERQFAFEAPNSVFKDGMVVLVSMEDGKVCDFEVNDRAYFLLHYGLKLPPVAQVGDVNTISEQSNDIDSRP